MFSLVKVRSGKLSASDLAALAVAVWLAASAFAADAPKPGEPTDEKARKTFATAIDWEKRHDYGAAMQDFRKANKQDGGRCKECLRRAYIMAFRTDAFKDAEEIARDMIPQAETAEEKAVAHYSLAIALQRQGIGKKKDDCFTRSCDEFATALDLEPKLALAHYSKGISLAYLHQDDAARREFAAFLEGQGTSPDARDRAQRYIDHIELARAIMAPPFTVTTLDGQRISMDGLAGKVVLIDFWATWCGPCREALPHIRQIAQKFAGQPFVLLSVNLDNDEDKWRSFVHKNGMTWPQCRDGGFNGQVAKQFGVTKIPATFTIDAEGVLEDQRVGDADIEGKLKKLVARAVEVADRKPPPAAPTAVTVE